MIATIQIAIAPRCTACGVCIVTCPERALVPAPGRPAPLDDRCTACYGCVEVCPVDAITIDEERRSER